MEGQLSQHVPWSKSYLPNRLHSWHTLQSILFPYQRGGATILLLSQPLPDCCISRAKCLPPAEPICTGRPGSHCKALYGALGHCVCGRVDSVWALTPWVWYLAALSLFFPTARHILHTAPVCSTPSRHPPHHGGAAQRHASDGIPCSHPSTKRQWGHHGYGGWDHYGHVSR